MVYNLHGPFIRYAHDFALVRQWLSKLIIALTYSQNYSLRSSTRRQAQGPYGMLCYLVRPFHIFGIDSAIKVNFIALTLHKNSTSSGTVWECLVHFARPFDKLRDRMGTYCYDFPVMIFLISLSLFRASMGVKLLMSTFLISSRMEASTGSSNWNRLSW